MLTPAVGAAVAVGDPSGFAGAAEQIEAASSAAKGHPAVAALKGLGLAEKPKAKAKAKAKPKARSRKRK
jgi:hypothetical protein